SADPADFDIPPGVRVVELLHAPDGGHEVRKLLELRPLVVDATNGSVDQLGCGDLGDHDMLLPRVVSERRYGNGKTSCSRFPPSSVSAIFARLRSSRPASEPAAIVNPLRAGRAPRDPGFVPSHP